MLEKKKYPKLTDFIIAAVVFLNCSTLKQKVLHLIIIMQYNGCNFVSPWIESAQERRIKFSFSLLLRTWEVNIEMDTY
jgi:hypothetical protein